MARHFFNLSTFLPLSPTQRFWTDRKSREFASKRSHLLRVLLPAHLVRRVGEIPEVVNLGGIFIVQGGVQLLRLERG